MVRMSTLLAFSAFPASPASPASPAALPARWRLGSRSTLVGAVSVSLAALASIGCAHGKSAEDRQIDELRDEIARVQSTSDKFEERLGKLEVDSADVQGEGGGSLVRGDTTPPPARTLSSPKGVATPSLRVVHLAPEGTEETGAAGETAGAVGSAEAEEGPPIRIQGSGSDAAIVNEKGRVRQAEPGGNAASTTVFTNANLGPSLSSHSASRPSALDEDAKHSYDAALGLVNGKQYSEALDALAGFLVRWPDHPNADNAMFWRGECYFAQGDYTNAVTELEGLLARFPLGNKAPDALLKIGIAEIRLDDADRARQRFDRLRREFPHSEAAHHIPAGAQTVKSAPSSRSSREEKDNP